MSNGSCSVADCGHPYTKETVINGTSKQIKCVEIGGQTFTISNGPVRIVRLEDEWYEDVKEPEVAIEAMKANVSVRADLFTFWQRLPDCNPRYNFPMESDSVAALTIKSYEDWWTSTIRSNSRRKVRKAQKDGVIVEPTNFTDDFVKGMVDIFNESPVRQGRPFWHYGKDFKTVKKEFSRFTFRENIFGAYFKNNLIGFIVLTETDNYTFTGQVISKIEHRDKAPNNALIAKAIEHCAGKGIPYLIYGNWPPPGSFADFKKQNGFEKIDLPRYYVPLTWRGKLALKYGLHREWKEMLPSQLRQSLKRIKASWYAIR